MGKQRVVCRETMQETPTTDNQRAQRGQIQNMVPLIPRENATKKHINSSPLFQDKRVNILWNRF
jgi:hypothetical protein